MVPHRAEDPRIAILFPAAGRADRKEGVSTGNSPAEFFYGSLAYGARHQGLVYGDTRATPDSVLGGLSVACTRLRNAISNFGLARPRVEALAEVIADADVAVSFTDAFSISLGYYRRKIVGRRILVGGYHGLCDMIDEVRAPFRPFARRVIRRGVRALDLTFFLGAADREEAIRRYGLEPERTFLFPFGVDTDFWCPEGSGAGDEGFVFAPGSDLKRDYSCLLDAPYNVPTRILTRLRIPENRQGAGVEVIRGSYHNVAVTDSVLRDLYRSAAVVVVPVRDVFQPSGQSVTLQAMACGKAVVLSRIKGLWDPEVFISGQNCILVRPGDPAELGAAIQRLIDASDLRARIGQAARETAVKSFGIKRMDDGLERMIDTAIRLGPRETAA